MVIEMRETETLQIEALQAIKMRSELDNDQQPKVQTELWGPTVDPCYPNLEHQRLVEQTPYEEWMAFTHDRNAIECISFLQMEVSISNDMPVRKTYCMLPALSHYTIYIYVYPEDG